MLAASAYADGYKDNTGPIGVVQSSKNELSEHTQHLDDHFRNLCTPGTAHGSENVALVYPLLYGGHKLDALNTALDCARLAEIKRKAAVCAYFRVRHWF